MQQLAAFLLYLVAFDAAAVSGQEAGWNGEAEVGANVFFGVTEQTLVTTRLEGAHADSTWELGGDGSYTYGKTTEDGESRLTNRTWSLSATADYLPFATISYFALGGIESSFERRIDIRSIGGGGIKYTFQRDSLSLLDLSLGLLAEKTSFDLIDAFAAGEEGSDLIARWSTRLRAKRTIGDDRIILESETFWRPRFDAFGNYTVATTNSVAYRITETIALKLSLIDIYDSQAEDRGARSNNDGRIFFSLLGTFQR